jgi:hypothetical protein
MNFKYLTIGLASVALAVIGCTVSEQGGSASAGDKVYANFPVTLKGYTGSKSTSEAYTGQMARQVLHDSLKKLAGKGNGKPNPALKAKMNSYYSGKTKGRAIVAPKSKGKFVIKQTKVDQISKKKNLSGKTYKGTIAGMPNNMSGPALVKFWIDKAGKSYDGHPSYSRRCR